MSNTYITVQNGKSTLISYLLWFFLGSCGVHKFYLQQVGWGIIYLSMFLLGDLLWFVFLGWILHIPLAIFLIIDLFTMPERVNKLNNGAANQAFHHMNR